MKLWSFQSSQAVQKLQEQRILKVSWDWYSPRDPYLQPYHWMHALMLQHGIDCGPTAPLWAWHSCGGMEHPPSLGTARNLLSNLQLEAGVQILSLECPQEVVLLSMYSAWNDIVDQFIDHGPKTKISLQLTQHLLHLPKSLEDYEAIQATLPFINLDWVTEIRPLHLSPDDQEVNWDQPA